MALDTKLNSAKNKPNQSITGCCHHGQGCITCKYLSPVNVKALEPWLMKYPDKSSAEVLLNGFSNGFKLGYMGERAPRDSPNLKSVKLDPETVLKKLDKEIGMGRIAGPFKSRPLERLMVSPIGLVPKAQPGKFRLIQHLSYPEGSSVNDGIDPNVSYVRYESFDTAVGLVASAGPQSLMAKADIESAFRLLPVHPDDFELLGIMMGDQFYVDKALPMGASCSPALFEKISTFLEWVAKQVTGSGMISHYADDYIFVGVKGQSQGSCSYLFERFSSLCQELGVPLATEKSIGPTSKLVYLGLEINSAQQSVSIPEDKVKSISAKIEKALGSEKITLKDTQSLIGSLSFVCRAVSPGRAFLRRLINLTCGIKKHWHLIRLSRGAKADLKMWLIFLQEFNGVAIIPDQMWVGEEDIELFTDASGRIGCGGYFKGQWFQSRWPGEIGTTKSITWLEFFPIVIAIVLWGHTLSGKRIILRSDNEAVVVIVNKQTSKCPHVMKLMRFMVLQCLKHNILFCAKHIPGKRNDIADALSRFQMERFRELAPKAAAVGIPVPAFLWTL